MFTIKNITLCCNRNNPETAIITIINAFFKASLENFKILLTSNLSLYLQIKKVLAIGIGEIMKGKEKEALQRNTKQNLFLASKVDGLKYKSEIMLDFTEAYKILGITAPEKV